MRARSFGSLRKYATAAQAAQAAAELAAANAAVGYLSFATKTAMDAFTGANPNQTAIVRAYPTAGPNDGVYRWNGSAWVYVGPNPDQEIADLEARIDGLGYGLLPGAQGVTYATDADGNVISIYEHGVMPVGDFWTDLVANAEAGAAVADVYGGSVLPGANGRTFISDEDGNVAWEGDSFDPAGGGGGDDTDTEAPIATDSATLARFRALLATKLTAGTGIIRVGIIGDSWTQNNVISTQLKTLLTAAYGTSGYGWISCDAAGNMTGLTHTRSGWTDFDASDLTGDPIAVPDPNIGSAVDGKAMYTSGTTAVASITVQCQTFQIFYRDGLGTFRYRVDGGSWTSVAGSNSGARAKIELTGLSDANHTIDIDTTSNTGQAVIYGYRGLRTAAGIEFNKLGNGGIEGAQWLPILPYQPAYWTDLALDIIVIILGTNDYRSTRADLIENYRLALTGLADGVRNAVPDADVILWGPADTNGVAQLPLIRFVEEMYRLSGVDELHCEFFNHHKMMGTWAEGDALGLWNDQLHPNSLGAFVASKEFVRRFCWL